MVPDNLTRSCTLPSDDSGAVDEAAEWATTVALPRWGRSNDIAVAALDCDAVDKILEVDDTDEDVDVDDDFDVEAVDSERSGRDANRLLAEAEPLAAPEGSPSTSLAVN